ncbi:hypothetical protein BC941DRAFT_412327 [Chlamydoabsidia padenii]|nr:hypothetical protein BC941DRAFT_412327 [Chlamydoabsidia padenii]
MQSSSLYHQDNHHTDQQKDENLTRPVTSSSTTPTEDSDFQPSQNLTTVDDSDDNEVKPAKRSYKRKIAIEYIKDKRSRSFAFTTRKMGIMKKVHDFGIMTGSEVLLIVISESNVVYSYTTTKLAPIVTGRTGRELVEACMVHNDIVEQEPHNQTDFPY